MRDVRGVEFFQQCFDLIDIAVDDGVGQLRKDMDFLLLYYIFSHLAASTNSGASVAGHLRKANSGYLIQRG